MENKNNKIFDSLTNIGKVAMEFSNAISESIKPMIELAGKVNEFLQSEKVRETFKNIAEGIIETEEDIINYKEVMGILGYPPSTSTDFILMRQIGREFIENGETNLREVIDDVMKDHYDLTKINEMKLEWGRHKFVKDRVSLLRQALTAHNLGMYALSIPSLLSQMEGIIIEGYKIKGKVNGYQFKKIVESLFINPDDESFDFNNEIRDFYIRFILDGFVHGQQIRSDVSRHAILHGGAKPSFFAKEEVSLKLILMMDNILQRINQLKDNEINEVKKELGYT